MKATVEIEDIVAVLAKHEVTYLLCGGFAVSLYATPRITADIDILLHFEHENVQRFMAAIDELQYKNQLPLQFEVLVDEETRRKYIAERNLIAYSFYSTLRGRMTLDVLVDVPIPFEELWQRKQIRTSENGYPVQLIGREDLIRLKEYAGREQDKADIILLSRVQNFLNK